MKTSSVIVPSYPHFFRRADAFPHIHRPGAQRQVQVGVASPVIVQVDVPQPGAVGRQNLLGGIVRDPQIGVSDIQVKPSVRDRVQQLASWGAEL